MPVRHIGANKITVEFYGKKKGPIMYDIENEKIDGIITVSGVGVNMPADGWYSYGNVNNG